MIAISPLVQSAEVHGYFPSGTAGSCRCETGDRRCSDWIVRVEVDILVLDDLQCCASSCAGRLAS